MINDYSNLSVQLTDYRKKWPNKKAGCLFYSVRFDGIVFVSSEARSMDKIGEHDLLHAFEIHTIEQNKDALLIAKGYAAYRLANSMGNPFDSENIGKVTVPYEQIHPEFDLESDSTECRRLLLTDWLYTLQHKSWFMDYKLQWVGECIHEMLDDKLTVDFLTSCSHSAPDIIADDVRYNVDPFFLRRRLQVAC